VQNVAFQSVLQMVLFLSLFLVLASVLWRGWLVAGRASGL